MCLLVSAREDAGIAVAGLLSIEHDYGYSVATEGLGNGVIKGTQYLGILKSCDG